MFTFDLPFFSEAVGECHGFVFQGLVVEFCNACAEGTDLMLGVEHIAQQPLQCFLGAFVRGGGDCEPARRERRSRDLKMLGKLLNRVGAKRDFMQTVQSGGIVDGFDDFADSLRVITVPNCQGSQNSPS